MPTPRYTFLLPSFKAQYFEEALLSIRNQTYTEFLCIVSDDCSPDDIQRDIVTYYKQTIFVSHGMDSVRELCRNGIVLKNGIIDYMGTANDCVEHYMKTI